jgi:glucosamine-6-phosphate deaminase
LSLLLTKLRLEVFDDYRTLSKYAALKISKVIGKNTKNKERKTVLGLATGSSPLGVYRELIKMYKEGTVDFSNCIFFNLDEYYGLAKNAFQSFNKFITENFFEHVGVSADQVNVPDGNVSEADVEALCIDYENRIRSSGGIDLQILGMGRNGHIGFNEPGSDPNSRTRLVTLSETTRRDASPDFFGLNNVPTRAITMGIGTISEAKEIIVLISGEHKAATLKRALEETPNAEVPASFLRYHPSVEWLCDRPASSSLVMYSTPWFVRPINWKREENVSRSALVWLSLRRRKKIDELGSEDFRSEGLASLHDSLGVSFARGVTKEFASKINRLDLLIREQPKGPRQTKILVFSPHPDDDVVCMGATMKRFAKMGCEVNVAYMVSGANAVKDLDVLNYLSLKNNTTLEIVSRYSSENRMTLDEGVKSIKQFMYSKAKGSPDHPIVREIKRDIRRQEALRAASRAGAKSTFFLNLPFYEEYGSARKAPLSNRDISIVQRLLSSLRPDILFVPGDSTDPNGTHSMCLDAIEKALSASNKEGKGPVGTLVFQYRGAWEEFTIEEADSIEPFNEIEMREKIEMILEHVSQLDPLFPGPYDDRQFWERARDRNISFAQLCNRIGVAVSGIGAEVFKSFALS